MEQVAEKKINELLVEWQKNNFPTLHGLENVYWYISRLLTSPKLSEIKLIDLSLTDSFNRLTKAGWNFDSYQIISIR